MGAHRADKAVKKHLHLSPLTSVREKHSLRQHKLHKVHTAQTAQTAHRSNTQNCTPFKESTSSTHHCILYLSFNLVTLLINYFMFKVWLLSASLLYCSELSLISICFNITVLFRVGRVWLRLFESWPDNSTEVFTSNCVGSCALLFSSYCKLLLHKFIQFSNAPPDGAAQHCLPLQFINTDL